MMTILEHQQAARKPGLPPLIDEGYDGIRCSACRLFPDQCSCDGWQRWPSNDDTKELPEPCHRCGGSYGDLNVIGGICGTCADDLRDEAEAEDGR